MKKTAFVINGAGGVGKDTLCDIAARNFRVTNISSITPVKQIAAACGWDGRKDDKSRKFLSDLKALLVGYNDYPTEWAKEKYDRFLEGDDEIFFVHIREPEEIRKFVARAGGEVKTLLIRGGKRFDRAPGSYGNVSDDGVENYDYDYVFVNDGTLEEAMVNFPAFLSKIMAEG